MKNAFAVFGLIVLLAAAAPAQSPAQTPAESPAQPSPQTPGQNAAPAANAPETPAGTTLTGILTGVWKGAFDFNGQSIPLTLNFTAAGGAVTGTVEGLPTTPAEIHDGKLTGDTVTFWLNTDYQDATYKLVYTGKVTAGQIAFTFGTDDGSWSSPLTVTRAAPDVTGIWKGAFDFNGQSIPLTLNLTAAGGAVTGTVEGLPTTPAAIHDGKIDGDTLTFWLTTDYQGQPYKLLYKGKIAASQIDFSFGTDDGSWGTEMTATRSM